VAAGTEAPAARPLDGRVRGCTARERTRRQSRRGGHTLHYRLGIGIGEGGCRCGGSRGGAARIGRDVPEGTQKDREGDLPAPLAVRSLQT